MKAEITRIGTVEEYEFETGKEDIIINWSFDGHGHTAEDFVREDGQQSYFGWSLAELRDISQAAEQCPLHKLGVLFS